MNPELGESSLECRQCGYVAKNSSQLTIHHRVHTGEYLIFVLFVYPSCFFVGSGILCYTQYIVSTICAVHLVNIWMHLLQCTKAVC